MVIKRPSGSDGDEGSSGKKCDTVPSAERPILTLYQRPGTLISDPAVLREQLRL